MVETNPASSRAALVVEGDPRLADALGHALDRMGFEVRTLVHYEDVAADLAARPPALVCVSLTLPHNSGYDVCDLIRSADGLEDVRILITSDRASPSDIAYAEEAGADAFLKKPFTIEQFRKYVTALFDPHRPSRPSVRRLYKTDPAPPR